MTPILIAATGLVGFIAGFLVAHFREKARRLVVEENLSDAREEIDFIKRESGRKQDEAKEEADQLKKELKKLRESAGDHARHLQDREEEVELLKARLLKADSAVVSATEDAETFRTSWQEAEQSLQQVRMEADRVQARVQALERQLSQSEMERLTLGEQLEVQQAELILAQQAAQHAGRDQKLPSTELFAKAEGSLQKILGVLLENDKQQVAVLSDQNGIVVAGAGERKLRDPVAATPQMVATLTRQLDGILPFGALHRFELEDADSRVICAQHFACAGETVGLATYGSAAPDAELVNSAVSQIRSILD